MTRPYFRWYGADVIGRRKWRRLSLDEKGALFELCVAGSVRTDEARWPNRAALVEVLDVPFAENIVQKLIELEWLDVADGGSISIHDWRQHQPSLPHSGAERTKQWRDRKRNEGDVRDARDGRTSRVTNVLSYPDSSHTEGMQGEPSRDPRPLSEILAENGLKPSISRQSESRPVQAGSRKEGATGAGAPGSPSQASTVKEGVS